MRGSGRFHNDRLQRNSRLCGFQSPSLRGSGRFLGLYPLYPVFSFLFQSPSLRGSGRFVSLSDAYLKALGLCFNPLHCGAVVASPRCCDGGNVGAVPVSIPFIAGQWSLPVPDYGPPRTVYMFQSPSLRGSGRFPPEAVAQAMVAARFNPLHCGAVVASVGAGRRRHDRRMGFNPLHCGAVVASQRSGCFARTCVWVSIPFIAGQWSLPAAGGRISPRSSTGFNPLHCGAVVASVGTVIRGRVRVTFQSPSLRGSGRFDHAATPRRSVYGHVSIPFIAGQWSLLNFTPFPRKALRLPFQSPSLRGSGRFLFFWGLTGYRLF